MNNNGSSNLVSCEKNYEGISSEFIMSDRQALKHVDKK